MNRQGDRYGSKGFRTHNDAPKQRFIKHVICGQ